MKIFVFSDNVNIFKAKYKTLDQLKNIYLQDSFIIDKLPIGAFYVSIIAIFLQPCKGAHNVIF